MVIRPVNKVQVVVVKKTELSFGQAENSGTGSWFLQVKNFCTFFF